MIFAIVIPPSALGKLLEEVVRALLRATLGEVQFSFVDKANSLPVNLIHDPKQHLLVSANAPNSAIVKQWVESRIPTIALVDDPNEIVRYVKTTSQSGLNSCLLTASACLSLTHDLVVDFAQVVLDRRLSSMGIRRLIEEIASFYKLPLTETSLSVVLSKLVQTAPREDCSVAALLEKRSLKNEARLSQFEEKLIDACLGPFGAMASRKPVRRATWPGALFAPAGDADTYFKRVDMVGRARILIFGPPLYLPQGHWKATSTFSVDNNDSGNVLVIDVYNGANLLAEGRCALPPEGQFSCGLVFEIDDPHRPFEVRFATGQGAIEGTFKLEEVMFERM